MDNRTPTFGEFLLFILLLAGIVLVFAGCAKTPRYVAEYQARPLMEKPTQLPMSIDEYPEWANKEWKHLIVEPRRNYGPGRTFNQSHYYVDPDTFNEQNSSYKTIENYTVVLHHSWAHEYTISNRDVRGNFEGFDEDNRGWVFPCIKKGKWHSGLGGVLQGDQLREGDIVKCEHCDRYYETGRIEFQRETGHLQWSRN